MEWGENMKTFTIKSNYKHEIEADSKKEAVEKWEEDFWKASKGEIPEDTADDVLCFIRSLLAQREAEVREKIKKIEIAELRDDPDSIMPYTHHTTLGERYGDRIDQALKIIRGSVNAEGLCAGCGEPLLDGESVIKGGDRHASCA